MVEKGHHQDMEKKCVNTLWIRITQHGLGTEGKLTAVTGRVAFVEEDGGKRKVLDLHVIPQF